MSPTQVLDDLMEIDSTLDYLAALDENDRAHVRAAAASATLR